MLALFAIIYHSFDSKEEEDSRRKKDDDFTLQGHDS